MPRTLSEAAATALAATDWARVDAMSDADLARQIGANPDAAPDMAPEIDVRALRLQPQDPPGMGTRRQTPQRPGAHPAPGDQGRSRGAATGVGAGLRRGAGGARQFREQD